MLPAEMADGTRAQVQRRREEAEAAEEGDANPAPNPEVVLQTTKMETTLLSSQIGKKMRQEMIML